MRSVTQLLTPGFGVWNIPDEPETYVLMSKNFAIQFLIHYCNSYFLVCLKEKYFYYVFFPLQNKWILLLLQSTKYIVLLFMCLWFRSSIFFFITDSFLSKNNFRIVIHTFLCLLFSFFINQEVDKCFSKVQTMLPYCLCVFGLARLYFCITNPFLFMSTILILYWSKRGLSVSAKHKPSYLVV